MTTTSAFEATLRAVFADGMNPVYDAEPELEGSWKDVTSAMMRMGAPMAHLEHTGGGNYVLQVSGEDPDDWVWIGAGPLDDDDTLCDTVAEVEEVVGRRYTIGGDPEDLWMMSDRQEIQVSSPDTYSVAEAMVALWRKLRTAPVVEEF